MNIENVLFGVCELFFREKPVKCYACKLDLRGGVLICEVDTPEFGSQIEQNWMVRNIVLQSSQGALRCEEMREPMRFASGGGFRMHIGATTLSSALSFEQFNSSITFRTNFDLIFEAEFSGDEVVVFPGLDLRGAVSLPNFGEVNGTKKRLSIFGAGDSADSENTLCAVSIAIGAPVLKFASLYKKTLTMALNNSEIKHSARPMFFQGFPNLDEDFRRRGFEEVFTNALTYLGNLENQKREGFRDSVAILLEGRATSSSYRLKILAAMHFLEWWDGSKTMAANQLVARLGIERCEADGILTIRNGFTHNNRDLRAVLDQGFEQISKTKRFDCVIISDGRASDSSALIYIYTLLSRVLLGEIGFSGEIDPYLPLCSKIEI